MAKPASTILSLAHVTVPELPAYDVALQDVSLTLKPGDLAAVILDPVHVRTPLSDVVCGVLTPESGKAIFLERDWCRTGASTAARLRGKIGRVFDRHGWVSNLDVDENVLLPHLHHRHGTEAELRQAAGRFAERFGLPALPETRPAVTRPEDLRRAAFVRAFLAEPCLLILERPVHGMPDLFSPLIIAIEQARERGAAVLWLDDDRSVADQLRIRRATPYQFDAASLVAADEAPQGPGAPLPPSRDMT